MKMYNVNKFRGVALKWFHSRTINVKSDLNIFLNDIEIMFGSGVNKTELPTRRVFELRMWMWSCTEILHNIFMKKLFLPTKFKYQKMNQ